MKHRHRNMSLTTLQHPKTLTRRMRRVMTRRMTRRMTSRMTMRITRRMTRGMTRRMTRRILTTLQHPKTMTRRMRREAIFCSLFSRDRFFWSFRIFPDSWHCQLIYSLHSADISLWDLHCAVELEVEADKETEGNQRHHQEVRHQDVIPLISGCNTFNIRM